MAVENVPALHEMHAAAVFAPTDEEYFPGPQFRQEAAEVPPTVENFPAGQDVQLVEPSTSE